MKNDRRPKSPSIWYAEYPGDYGRKTAHLSLVEHGAYLLLRHHYYSTGKPLPANADVLLRVCCALADDEKAAVLRVVEEFFVLEADGYHNRRCDEEIAKRGEISKKRSAAGIAGSLARANAPASAAANADTHAPADAAAGAQQMNAFCGTTTTATFKKEDPTTTTLDPTPAREPEGGGGGDRKTVGFHEQILQAAAIDWTKDTSGKWFNSEQQWTVSRWENDLGLTRSTILAVVRETTASRKNGPPGSLAYFDQPMQRAAARAKAEPLRPAADDPSSESPEDFAARMKRIREHHENLFGKSEG